jgi:ribosomal protein S18 acetylase RimI-like enzyme
VGYLRSRESISLGAFSEGKLAGLPIAFTSIDGLANIDWLVVDRNFRKIGTAQRMVGLSEDMAKRKSMLRVWCDTSMRNEKSMSLFRKMHYDKAATLKDWGYHWDCYFRARKLQ